MADPDPPQPPQPAQPAVSPLVATFNPYATVNLDEARKQKEQYGADLEKTRGALSQVQGLRQDVTTRNLAAIDESIKGLQDSRTGTYGLDPAVTAALAAGFLKPGGSGGFLGELGTAMGAAAPVVSNLQKQDRDSFQILADLQRKRGEFEAEPLKERQTELSAREKLEFANLKEAEKALARAPAASAVTGQQKVDIDKEKLAADFIKSLEPEMKSYTEDKMDAEGNALSPEQKDAIRRYIRHNRITENNFGKKEGDPGYIDPGRSGMKPGDEETATHLMRTGKPLLKGVDKIYNDYVLSERAQGREPKIREIWEADNKGNATFAQQRAKDDAEKLDKVDSILRTGKNTTETIDRLLANPGLDKVVGTGPATRFLPNMSNEASSFVQQMKHFQSELFLQGVASMKGMGQLSDAEGRKLESAIGAIGTIQNPADFRAELVRIKGMVKDLEAAVQKDIATIKARRGIDQPKPPEVGEIRDGHRFKGGNPGDPKNWEPV